jgi:DNA-binding PadR family transcriptional regulator
MGLMYEKSMNPYELTKLVDMDVIKAWFPLTAPSIYTTIKNIEKKGYIIGEQVQEGNFPTKTLYSLTEKGEKQLREDMETSLKDYEIAASNFGISIFHIGTLNKEDALIYAKQRAETLSGLLEKAKVRLRDCKDKIPFNLKMMLTYNIYKLEMELKVVNELVEEIQNTHNWDTSFVRFIKD